jgi:hypothetical protein
VSEVHFYKPDWVLIEAAKRSGWVAFPVEDLRDKHNADIGGPFRALCTMIESDTAVKAREALIAEWLRKHGMRQTAMMLEKGAHLK